MFLKFKIFVYNLLFIRLKWWYRMYFDPLIKSQIRKPHSIPIIIINFNQLFYLKKLVDFLLKRKFENIIIVDNLSTYPPLLEYYKTLKGVTIEYMDDNYGHEVFFENKELQKKYGQGFYVLTDADIVPNENLPTDFMKTMLNIITKKNNTITKVGFALDVENIPDTNIVKDKVLNWEKQFWKIKVSDFVYDASIDTTFALYKYGYKYDKRSFYNALRLAGCFTAQHGGWIIDHRNLTAEQRYYINTVNASHSWRV